MIIKFLLLEFLLTLSYLLLYFFLFNFLLLFIFLLFYVSHKEYCHTFFEVFQKCLSILLVKYCVTLVGGLMILMDWGSTLKTLYIQLLNCSRVQQSMFYVLFSLVLSVAVIFTIRRIIFYKNKNLYNFCSKLSIDSITHKFTQNQSIICLIQFITDHYMYTQIPDKDYLQTILQQRIGYGKAQKLLLVSIYILLFSEGAQSIVLGLLIPQLGQQWNIGIFQKSLLITIVYVGVAFGSYIQAYSDKYGRYRFLLLDSIITCVFGLLSAFCINFQMFLIIRFFYGVGIGIALPLTATYIIEIVPKSHRGTILAYSRIYWALGSVFTSLISWLLMVDGHWRITLLILSLPNLYALYDIYKNGKQSIRYLWVNGQIKACKQTLDFLAVNNGAQPIPAQQISNKIKQTQKDKQIEQQNKVQFRQLLNAKYFKQTFILSYLWGSGGFIFYAVVLILPTILSRNGDFLKSWQYGFMIMMSIVEVFAFYLSRVMMDHPILGRKKSIYYSTMFISILTFSIIFIGQGHHIWFSLAFIGIKIFSTTAFNILNPYSTEIYETKLRSQAMATFSLFARISTALMGMVGISSLQWLGGIGLYLIIMVLSGLQCILVYQMPYCTLGRQLDT